MHTVSTITPTHTIPPDALRGVILARKVKVSDPVARLMAEIIFGHIDRDHGAGLPASISRGGR